MKNVIYYFSGTGNSLRAASRIAEQLKDTEVISMRNDPQNVPATKYEMIGFVYPVYHWTMPDPVVSFIEELKMNTKAYVFVVAMPSFVNGFACEKLEEIVTRKVNGVANYEIVYPPMPSAKWVVPKTEEKISRIAREIAERKNKEIPRANAFVRKRYPKVMPVYKSLQQYADYPFTISKECIACGLCAKVCPCQNISMEEGKPTFLHHCAQCMACVSFCPKRAIGYQLREDDLKQLKSNSIKAPVIKMMGLPEKRKLYHNPYIEASDLIKDRIEFK